jgi:hypothetical protein
MSSSAAHRARQAAVEMVGERLATTVGGQVARRGADDGPQPAKKCPAVLRARELTLLMLDYSLTWVEIR